MAIDRRLLMIGSMALVAAPAGLAHAGERMALFAAARRDHAGRHSAAIFDGSGRDVAAVALAGRGHDLTVSTASGHCVVFARRPGNYAVAFSADRHMAPILFTTPADRHFYGHGVFSRDGRLLYATENDFDAGRGVIGLYDATGGYRRIGEWLSYGVGPHDLALLRRRPVLVVANGGLREHPDFGGGRRILNPDSIESSLAYIDLATGDLLDRAVVRGPGAGLSLRHLEVTPADEVILGAQLLDPRGAVRPLIWRQRDSRPLSPVELPESVEEALSGYVSSISIDAEGRLAVATSSRGGAVVLIDLATQRVVATRALADVSGIAPGSAGGGFLATSGEGKLMHLGRAGERVAVQETRWHWDNHAIAYRA